MFGVVVVGVSGIVLMGVRRVTVVDREVRDHDTLAGLDREGGQQERGSGDPANGRSHEAHRFTRQIRCQRATADGNEKPNPAVQKRTTRRVDSPPGYRYRTRYRPGARAPAHSIGCVPAGRVPWTRLVT